MSLMHGTNMKIIGDVLTVGVLVLCVYYKFYSLCKTIKSLRKLTQKLEKKLI